MIIVPVWNTKNKFQLLVTKKMETEKTSKGPTESPSSSYFTISLLFAFEIDQGYGDIGDISFVTI